MNRRVIYKTLETAYALAASATIAYPIHVPLSVPDRVVVAILAAGDISWVPQQGLIGFNPIAPGSGLITSSAAGTSQIVTFPYPLPIIQLIITDTSAAANSLKIGMAMIWG